jgi:TonB family protein
MMVLVKFIASSAILLLFFHLFLAKEKSFELNRWILLALIPAAIIIPFLHFPIFLPNQTPVRVDYLPIDLYQSTPSDYPNTGPNAPYSPLQWFLVVYILGFFFLLFTKLKALNQLISWTKTATVQHIPGAFLILSEKVSSPFSFRKYIFMHPNLYKEGSEVTKMILTHERYHITHRHHVDLIWMEILTVVCWFNPVVYLVKKAVVLNHEYLADQEVQQKAHPLRYKQLLLELTVKKPTILSSSMSSSTLKNRLIMMNRPLIKTMIRLRTISFVLLSTMMIAGFSVELAAQETSSTAQSPAEGTGDTFFEVETQPEFKGGMNDFYKYVVENIGYPLRARKNGIEGEVVVQFVVENDGSLSNVKALNEIAGGCEEEAVRVVRNSPDFKPGLQRGRPVRVQMVLPIHFRLDKKEVADDGYPTGKIIVEGIEQRNGKLNVDATYKDGLWTGTIRDPEGNTLPGAHIIIVDSTVGTVTDIDGRFTIKAGSSQNLVASFVGYQSAFLAAE